MQIRKKIVNILTHNWKPKLVCLGIAILVWLGLNKLVDDEETPVWEVNEVLFSQPE